MTAFRCHDANACAMGQNPCPTPSICGCQAPECATETAAELRRLQQYTLTLQAGYDAARLEIESLRARAQAAPAAVAGPTPDGMLDDDGENRAVRMFLAAYGTPGLTVATMRRHMELAGWTQSPEWTTKPDAQGHLTKAGAQSWLRHLFALEAAAPTTQLATQQEAQKPVAWPLAPQST